MSSDPLQFASDAPLVAELAAAPRKGMLTNIGVLVLLMAMLGLVGLCFSGGLVATNINAAAPTAPAADATAMQRFEYAVQVEWQGVTQRYVPALAGFFGCHVIVVALMMIGSIRVFWRSDAGRQFLLYALLLTLLFEVLRSGLYLVMLLEMMPLVDQILVRELRGLGAQSQQMETLMKRMAQGLTVFGILVALVWPALKIVFYGWCARYLASQEAIDICQTPSSSPARAS